MGQFHTLPMLISSIMEASSRHVPLSGGTIYIDLRQLDTTLHEACRRRQSADSISVLLNQFDINLQDLVSCGPQSYFSKSQVWLHSTSLGLQ